MAQNPVKTYGPRGRAQEPDRRALLFAAALLWEDRATDAQIAAALGISRRTLARWKHRPDMRLALELQQLMWQRTWRLEGDTPRHIIEQLWDADRLGPLL